jgi:hypothetical protein
VTEALADVVRHWPGDTAGYHLVYREFSLTEGSAPGTRGCSGAGCRYRRRFVADTR